MRPLQILSLQVRVDLGVMTMNRYSTLPRSPKLGPRHQMKFSIISRILFKERGLTPLLHIQHILSSINKTDLNFGDVLSHKEVFVWFGLVGFYGISTIVGYLMPNPLYTYVLSIYMICKHFEDNIFKWARVHFLLHTVKWFQVFLYNSHNLTAVICLHTFCSIWPIDRTLSGATNLDQSGPKSNDNEGVYQIYMICK